MQRPRPAALAHLAHAQGAVVPVADGVDELLSLGVAVLAEQVDLVALAYERRRQARVVDVRSGAAEQIAVEDEDAHGASLAAASPFVRSRRALR